MTEITKEPIASVVVYKFFDSIFQDISINGRGAGISLNNENASLLVIQTQFVRCVTTNYSGGGGIYARVKEISCQCSFFDNCYAPDQGAAFIIDSTCKNTTFSSITNIQGISQDSFIRFGHLFDLFENINSTEIAGGSNIYSNWPESQTTSLYKYHNAINTKATGHGLFYESSSMAVEKSNIMNCSCSSFLRIKAANQPIFKLASSVITGSIGKLFSDSLTTQTIVQNNIYGSDYLVALFGGENYTVTSNPHAFNFIYPSCDQKICYEMTGNVKVNGEGKITIILLLVNYK